MKFVEIKKYHTLDDVHLCDILKDAVMIKTSSRGEIVDYVKDNKIYRTSYPPDLSVFMILHELVYEKLHPELEVRIIESIKENPNLPKILFASIFQVKESLVNLGFYSLNFYIMHNVVHFYYKCGLHEFHLNIHSSKLERFELFIRTNSWGSEMDERYGDLGDVVNGYFRNLDDCLYLLKKYLLNEK